MVAQIDLAYARARPLKAVSRLMSYALFEGRPLTTRGRWINPIVFAMCRFLRSIALPTSITKPIFIVGTGRSGTTILGVVLSMHREVGFLNEPKALWHSAFRGEDVVGNYTSEGASYRLGSAEAGQSVRKAISRLYRWYLFATRSKRVVDKYPELIFRVQFIRELFPDAKFLFLVRNGWDTCRSVSQWSQRLGVVNGDGTHDWWGVNNRKWELMLRQLVPEDEQLHAELQKLASFTSHSDMAAVEWILTMREGLRVSAQFPDAVYTVRYEDLVESPEESLRGIRRFCELAEDPVFERYGRQVLRPGSPAKPFMLHPCLERPFKQTMVQLGYVNE